MKIVYLAAGAAGAYCGACARDTTLTRGLVAAGHNVDFLALYTPIKSDIAPPGNCPIFFGGISVYLQQRVRFFRHTPAFLDRIFDASWLLDMVERFAIDTKPEDLGEMTVSVLKGAEGNQKKELARLMRFLSKPPRPDVVNITNSLLSAIAPAVKEAIGVPVVCNLQGEDVFVQRLGNPWRDEAIRLIRSHASAVDAFVAPSEGYADAMAGFLAVDRSRIRVIRPGIDTAAYETKAPRPRDVFRIGYLSRVTPAKGIDVLCEAFRRMETQSPGRSRLEVAGNAAGSDKVFWEKEMDKMRADGLSDRVEYIGSPDLAGKIAFLRRLSVFSVPSRYPERQAIAALEAMATGCPVVLPDRGIEHEILQLAGGGIAVKPDDAGALADALSQLRDDPVRREALGREAATGIAEHFSDRVMIDRTLGLYTDLAKPRP